MELLKNILLMWRQYGEFRAALTALNSSSDRELAGLGITRGDIARAAYEEAERHMTTLAASESAPASAWQNPALVPGR